MPVLRLVASLKKIWLKMSIIFSPPKGTYFDLVLDFMPVLVTCKFDGD